MGDAKVAVITGTTHGIGRVTARELAGAGYRLLMLCRNAALAGAVRAEIMGAVPGAAVGIVACDLGSLDSVRNAARIVQGETAAIDLLVNNAGIVSTLHRMSVDGFELTFATNHLGPFLLTELLRPRLRAGARIVNVASCAHLRGRLDPDTLRDPHALRDPRARYRPVEAYNRSKLANVLHTFALARRLEGSGITANCLHPGVVATHLLPRWLRLVKPLFSAQMLDAERGARTTLYLALSDEVAGVNGRYYDEFQRPQPASALANDVQLQEALWEASLRCTTPSLRSASTAWSAR